MHQTNTAEVIPLHTERAPEFLKDRRQSVYQKVERVCRKANLLGKWTDKLKSKLEEELKASGDWSHLFEGDFDYICDTVRSWAKSKINRNGLWEHHTIGGVVCISSNPAGLECALDMLGIDVRYNKRSQQIELLETDKQVSDWTPFTDRNESALRDTVAMRFAFEVNDTSVKAARFGQVAWTDAINAIVAKREVDPFRDYLSWLPKWDGRARLDTWLESIFDVSANEISLVRWAAKTVLLLAVTRTYEPGKKHDEMPVLVGPQECGKSTALAFLVPQNHRKEWFTDELRLSDDAKRRVEALQGSVIVELAEMSGATTAELKSLKAFLSRSIDHVRLAYRRNPEAMPRTCAIIGTANPGGVLPNDPTGNRRFVTLEVKASQGMKYLRSWLDDNREQLWAEAVHRYNEGEELFLPDGLKGFRDAANEAHHYIDESMEDNVRRFLDKMIAEKKFMFRVNLVGAYCGFIETTAETMKHGDTIRITKALRRLGCSNKMTKVDGKMTRQWVIPRPGG